MLKADEISNMQKQLDEIHEKSSTFIGSFRNVQKTVMFAFEAQLKEYMTSINNEGNYGLDSRLPNLMKSLHSKVDNLIDQVDRTRKEGQEFFDAYNKQLKEKKKFYEEQEHHAKVNEKEAKKSAKEEKPLKLSEETLKDIEFGADNIRTAIKEKYLGRLPGTKRGEVATSYSSDNLIFIMSFSMITILLYVSRQVHLA